jgi:hypothetical protein
MPAFEETQTLAILDIENGTSSSCTISELRAGKPLVLDLWHTKCTRCPDALTKLDMLAASGKHAGVVFASCALSLCDKPDGPESEDAGREQVTELIDDMWDNLKHCYMTVCPLLAWGRTPFRSNQPHLHHVCRQRRRRRPRRSSASLPCRSAWSLAPTARCATRATRRRSTTPPSSPLRRPPSQRLPTR